MGRSALFELLLDRLQFVHLFEVVGALVIQHQPLLLDFGLVVFLQDDLLGSAVLIPVLDVVLVEGRPLLNRLL